MSVSEKLPVVCRRAGSCYALVDPKKEDFGSCLAVQLILWVRWKSIRFVIVEVVSDFDQVVDVDDIVAVYFDVVQCC